MAHSASQPNSTSERAAQRLSVLGVGAERIAKVYAEALFRVARDAQQLETVAEDLHFLTDQLVQMDPQIRDYFANATISHREKSTAIEQAFRGRLADITVDFLQVLNSHVRLEILVCVEAAFRELVDEHLRRVRVRLRSAIPLTDDARGRLIDFLTNRLQLQPVLEETVDPDLLGGFVLRVADWLYDGSVAYQLESLRKQLLERSSHEIQSRGDRFSSANGN